KKNLFWILNISGWLILTLLWIALYFPDDFKKGEYGFLIFKYFNSNFIIPFIITTGVRYLFKRVSRKNYTLLKISGVIIISSLIASFLWFYIDILSTIIIFGDNLYSLFSIPVMKTVQKIINMSVLMSLWGVLYFIINIFFDWQEEKRSKERALLLATEARLEVLKNQINPHFLFNSLNTISALIEENQTKAQIVIDELSGFLRYTLTIKSSQKIKLRDEINFIKHYIKIQSVRFEEKLECIFDIAKDTEELCIPPAILYPIVENAIKHGINTSDFPLKLYVYSFIKKDVDDSFILGVKNSGLWINTSDTGKGTNTGINNVKERLFCEYHGDAGFNIIIKPGFVDVQISLPLQEKNAVRVQGNSCG
ncbi:MAG: histidine kinase, partial [Bacteroidales bacterium]|nr:histidine kinase [Bacteroidales bacterium]